jgi:hypothetical protein
MFQTVSSDGLRCNKTNRINVNQIRFRKDGEAALNPGNRKRQARKGG